MTMTVAYRGERRPDDQAAQGWAGFFREFLIFDVGGTAPDLASVRPLVDDSADAWPGRLDSAIDAPRGAVVGLVSESPRDAAFFACSLASWAGASGRDVVLIDGSVEAPVLEKPLSEHGDEGFVDTVLFGVSPAAAAKRTLTSNVRVMTAGSHPLAVESVFGGPDLRGVLGGLGADLILLILPLGYHTMARGVLDVIVAVAGDQRTLESVALESLDGRASHGVALMLNRPSADRRADVPPPAGPEDETPGGQEAIVEPGPVEPTREPVEPAVAGATWGAGTSGTAMEPQPRRNEFIRSVGADSPYLDELPPEPEERTPQETRPRVRLGFIGWLALVAIVVIVGLTIFDMTLRPRRLAWREPPVSEQREALEQSGAPPSDVPVVEQVAEEAAPAAVDDEANREIEMTEATEAETLASEAGTSDEPYSSESLWMEDEPPAEDAGLVLSGPGGPYVVMLSSHKLRSAADWEAEEAESHGIPVRVVEAEIPGRGVWYRIVLAGGHPTLASARAALDIVKELGYEGAWLTRETQDD